MKPSEKVRRLLTPEFRLLTACAWLEESGWPAQRQWILSLLSAGVDPAQFLSLVKRHRVQVIAYAVLSRAANEGRVDVEWIQRLRPSALRTRIGSLRLHAEWQRIDKLCRDASIKVRTLKGAALSMRLYQDASVRHTRDIDVLVAPADMERMLDLLEDAGYQVDRGFAPHRRHTVAFRIARSLEYHTTCTSNEGLVVEVHSHIERPLHSSMDTEWSELAWSSAPESEARFDLLYCTLHGCLHGWSRLKWLGDLRVMAGRVREDEWPDVIRQAEELRLQTLLSETLLLLHWITDFELPQAAEALVRKCNKCSYRLAEQAMDWIAAPECKLHGLTIPDKVRQWQLGWSVGRRLPMAERATYWISQALFSSTDMRALDLPAWLTGLYPVIRPVAFIGRSMFGGAFKSR